MCGVIIIIIGLYFQIHFKVCMIVMSLVEAFQDLGSVLVCVVRCPPCGYESGLEYLFLLKISRLQSSHTYAVIIVLSHLHGGAKPLTDNSCFLTLVMRTLFLET